AAAPRPPRFLRGKKTKTPISANRARGAAAVTRADGLRGVFDDDQIMLTCDGEDGIHVGGQAEQVDGHDRASLRRDGGFEQSGIDVESDWIDVHKNWLGAGVCDGAGGGNETK